ncbi:T9SS type A sorting domain-containing protein [Flavobacteriales bacterium]|nr:T9SS type A sorting domain-containing protein [Flavobacteriales bacterium]
MKFVVLAFCLILSLTSNSQNWSVAEVASLPEPVANNAVCEGFTPAGSFVYSFAGIDSSLEHSGIHLKSWRINTQTLQVDVLPDLPDTLGKVATGASRVGNIIYIIGGYHVFANGNEISSNKVHRFDVAQNHFISDGAPIPVPIDDHVQAVYRDSLIFLVTGWSNTGNVADVQIYNAYTDSWQVGTYTPNTAKYKCFGASGEILGDTIYYFGGAAGGAFAAQTELRKGYINPNDPTEITWSESEPEPVTTGYRAAATKTSGVLHWLGGSNVTYNFDAVAYNGSGLVQPADQTVFYHPNSGLWGYESVPQLPMDLRGIGNISPTQKYIIGGIGENGTVLSSVIRLDYEGTLSVDDEKAEGSPFIAPNPAVGFLRTSKKGDLNIYNSTGKLVLSITTTNQEQINISNLPIGIYFASLQFSNRVYRQRLIIAK